MIIAWIIGLLLSILGIWFLKNSRFREVKWYGKVEKPERPVLKMWGLLLLIIGAIIPILNIIVGAATIIAWIVGYSIENLVFTKKDNKVSRFLNKPIQ